MSDSSDVSIKLSQTKNINNQYDSYTDNQILQDSHKENEILIERNQLSYDEIQEQIGFGKFHLLLFFLMGLVGSIDGSESLFQIKFLNQLMLIATCISLVIPVLKKKWNISMPDESLMGSVVYGAYLIGNILSGQIGDRFGRRKPIIFASLFATLFALMSAFSLNFLMFIVFRGLFGSCVGFMVPLSFSMLAENTPVSSRGKFLTLVGLLYTLGEMFAILIALFTFKDLDNGNWRALLSWSSFPALATFLTSLLILKESARFEIIKGNLQNGINIINHMAAFNQKNKFSSKKQFMDQTKIQQLLLWRDSQLEQNFNLKINNFQSNNNFALLKKLFQGSFKYITPIIWNNWFTNAFIYYGINFLLPLTLDKNSNNQQQNANNNLIKLFLTTLAELPTPIIACIISDINQIGRRYSLASSYFLAGACSLFIQFKFKPSFSFWAGGSKLFANLAFTLNYQYTGELYPTIIRASGLGFANAFSGLGQLIMPWIGVYIGSIGIYIPFTIFGVMSIFSSVLTCLIKFETRQQELDKFG